MLFRSKFRLESFEIITTFSIKGRVIKSSYIAIVMVFFSVSIHQARMRSAFFGGLRASRRRKFKKNIILENINHKKLNLVFSKIVS